MNNMLRMLSLAVCVALACAAQAHAGDTPGNTPSVLLPYGVSTVAPVHTPLSGPVVTLPVRGGIQPGAMPASVPTASADTTAPGSTPAK